MGVCYLPAECGDRHMVGSQYRYYSTDNSPRDSEKRSHLGDLVDPRVMLFGDKLQVAAGLRIFVEEGKTLRIFVHDLCRLFPLYDAAKDALGHNSKLKAHMSFEFL